jgi:uncharacterized protein (TIGR01777 family)
MRLLITGATGLIGSALTAAAIKEGYQVNYLSPRRSALEQQPNLRGFYWDPEKETIDKQALDGVEVIIHLAGASIAKRWTEQYKQTILQSRTRSAGLLLQTLKASPHNVRHFISASGIAFYPTSETATYDEEYPTPDDSFLGQVVEQWEASANAFRDIGLKVSIVRTGLVLSEKGGALPQMARPVKWGLGAPLGSGGQWQSWIHLEDMIRIYLYLIDKGLEGVFNGVAPYPVTNKDFTRALAHALGKPTFLPNVPAFVLRAMFGEMSILLLKGQKVLPGRLDKEGFDFQFSNIESALSDLYH